MEVCIPSSFMDLNNDLLLELDGGTFWGVVSGTFQVIAGVAEVVGGAALIAVPEPTTVTKFAGGAAVITGSANVLDGIKNIAENW